MELITKKVDVSAEKNQSLVLDTEMMVGCLPIHHTIVEGSSLEFEANIGKHHVVTLIQGTAVFLIEGKEYTYSERVTVIPGLTQPMTIRAESNVQILELLMDMDEDDYEDLKTFECTYPYIQLYKTSEQYRDEGKSEKTISRIMVKQRNVPRFAMGSVESYGPDHIVPHAHPLLDQYFFSFPENNMTVLIDDESLRLEGNTLLYIPLGSNHGVDVLKGEVMHYTWVDVMVDRKESTARLDKNHVPTGLMRSFDDEDKFRKP